MCCWYLLTGLYMADVLWRIWLRRFVIWSWWHPDWQQHRSWKLIDIPFIIHRQRIKALVIPVCLSRSHHPRPITVRHIRLSLTIWISTPDGQRQMLTLYLSQKRRIPHGYPTCVICNIRQDVAANAFQHLVTLLIRGKYVGRCIISIDIYANQTSTNCLKTRFDWY